MIDGINMIAKIKKLCNDKNIKISELESEVGLSKGNLSRWAKSCPSSIEVLAKISKILNTSIDYILDTSPVPLTNNNTVLDMLISKTDRGEVAWSKLSYLKAKKIPVIKCVNEIVYEENVSVYETSFNNKHLIFVSYKNTCTNQLFIENNNDYIIVCNNNSYTEKIARSIEKGRADIINEFFTIDDEKAP